MGADLCTLQQVIDKGYIIDTSLNSLISNQISEISDEIRFDCFGTTDDTTLSINNLDARRACIFGVLAWMEYRRLIPSTRLTRKEREGGTELDYGTTTLKNEYKQLLSYADEFARYMARLVPMPPVGSKIPCRPYWRNREWY